MRSGFFYGRTMLVAAKSYLCPAKCKNSEYFFKKNTNPAIPGVDFEARTVQLAPGVEAAPDHFEGLKDFFYSMAFSHKKEYAEVVEAAKKPETRLRRIEQMTNMLLEKQGKKNK